MIARPWDAYPRKPLTKRLAAALRDPGKILCYVRYRLNRCLVRKIVIEGEPHYAYRGDLYPDSLHHGNACSFIAERASAYCSGSGIDIGAGEWPFPGATPVRDEPDRNAYRLDSIPDGSLDYVFSSHCLEHLDRWSEALSLWIRKLRPGGVLFLYLPHESMKMWQPCGPWVGLGHKWRPRHEVLVPFLAASGLTIVEFNPARDTYWSFHIVARRVASGGDADADERRSASKAPMPNQNGTVTLSTPR
jgi:SAM-dependent methyltransferase